MLVTSWLGSGHIRPLLACVDELAHRGHEVLVVSEPGVEAFGLEVPVSVLPPVGELLPGLDRNAFKISQSEREPGLRAAAATDHFLRQAEALTPHVVKAIDRYRPDVIYRDYSFDAGWLAGFIADIPVATFAFFPMSPAVRAARFKDRYLQAIETVGATGALDVLDQWLTVCGLPASWFGSDPIPRTMHLVQPKDPAMDDDGTPGALLAGLPDRPTVYATLGTEFNDLDRWDLVFDAIAPLDVNVIATLGATIDPSSIAVPDNVRVAAFVPQQCVLPKCQAVIAHGGYGSLRGALRHGLPVVSIPAGAADNVPNAIRLTLIGAGLAVMPHARTSGEVRAALLAVLEDPSYGVAARSVAAEIEALPPAKHAATPIEQLVETGEPVLAR